MSAGKGLLEKLRVKGGEIAVIGAPPDVMAEFRAFQPKAKIPAGSKGQFDFVLLFAVTNKDLNAAWKGITGALKQDAVFWVCYPKKGSGIASDLAGMTGWTVYKGSAWQPVSSASIDETWTGIRFKYAPGLESQRQERPSENILDTDGAVVVDRANRVVTPPQDLAGLLSKHGGAKALFDSLSFTHRKEYVTWIVEAKKPETRAARLKAAIEKMAAGKKNPAEK